MLKVPEKYRVTKGSKFSSFIDEKSYTTEENGNNGFFMFDLSRSVQAKVFANENGPMEVIAIRIYDIKLASRKKVLPKSINRTATIDELWRIKDIFFHADDEVFQLFRGSREEGMSLVTQLFRDKTEFIQEALTEDDIKMLESRA